MRSLRAARVAEERPFSPTTPAFVSLFACLSRVYFSRYPPDGEFARRQKSAIQDSGCLWGVLQSLEGNFEGSKNVFKSLAKEARWYELSTATKVGRVC